MNCFPLFKKADDAGLDGDTADGVAGGDPRICVLADVERIGDAEAGMGHERCAGRAAYADAGCGAGRAFGRVSRARRLAVGHFFDGVAAGQKNVTPITDNLTTEYA